MLALVLVACGSRDRRDPSAAGAPSAPQNPGPDPLALRIPRAGGPASVAGYPQLDSALWTSSVPVPAIARIVAFDQEAGSVAAITSAGISMRIDLRLGRVTPEPKTKLTGIASADGWAVFGISDGAVQRLTPSGEGWSVRPPAAARLVIPNPDGTVVIAADRGTGTTLWRLRPPDKRLADTVDLPRASLILGTPIGDRVYLAVDSGLVGVRTRDLTLIPAIRFPARVTAIAPTPSGDRLYVLTAGERAISIVDRYRDRVSGTVKLPDVAVELRMDPIGRYLLARPATGDSAWIVAIGTDMLLGSVHTAWRVDLPAVAPDGALALVRGKDVIFADPETKRDRKIVAGGAGDFWFFFQWNGFRPRATALDEPVQFATIPGGRGGPDTAGGLPSAPEPNAGRAEGAGGPAPDAAAAALRPSTRGFIVSFATLLTPERADELAKTITIRGEHPHVLVTSRGNDLLYRVVMGPFTARADADHIGREAGRDYWIIEGPP